MKPAKQNKSEIERCRERLKNIVLDSPANIKLFEAEMVRLAQLKGNAPLKKKDD